MRLILLAVVLGYISYRGIQDWKANRITWRAVVLPYLLVGLAFLLIGFVATVLFGVGQ